MIMVVLVDLSMEADRQVGLLTEGDLSIKEDHLVDPLTVEEGHQEGLSTQVSDQRNLFKCF